MKRVRWGFNSWLAVVVVTIAAAGFWFVTGRHVGGQSWAGGIVVSLVMSTLIDLTKRRKGNAA